MRVPPSCLQWARPFKSQHHEAQFLEQQSVAQQRQDLLTGALTFAMALACVSRFWRALPAVLKLRQLAVGTAFLAPWLWKSRPELYVKRRLLVVCGEYAGRVRHQVHLHLHRCGTTYYARSVGFGRGGTPADPLPHLPTSPLTQQAGCCTCSTPAPGELSGPCVGAPAVCGSPGHL